MQTALTIMVPTLVVLVGILLNRQDYSRLDAKIEGLDTKIDSKIDNKVDGLRADLTSQINELRNDIKEFYRTLGRHDARLDALERQRKA
ncbi:hypothetical protein [Silvibacterium dinghuense]|uniref:Uncharacterized protein n=1 Tax=Silvibacterium dinghuense TaxID=1560006 RepID=A0A4Q1SKG8_9BACT|nr:hypothetical protein [Silvibacterium dinghuense]RXS97959.1 hypothetical protein ESZ00_08935 [Silvibacterium dinghuense]GGH03362.1 hypothetical protein GCM10011586_19120 [Silvibacterium dinghuense]